MILLNNFTKKLLISSFLLLGLIGHAQDTPLIMEPGDSLVAQKKLWVKTFDAEVMTRFTLKSKDEQINYLSFELKKRDSITAKLINLDNNIIATQDNGTEKLLKAISEAEKTIKECTADNSDLVEKNNALQIKNVKLRNGKVIWQGISAGAIAALVLSLILGG